MIKAPNRQRPGRPDKATFPIIRTVVIRGTPRKMIIRDNQLASCIRCGYDFMINSDTVRIIRLVIGASEYVRCPHCNTIADAYYYLQEPPRPRIRTEQKVIPWTKPEM